jgi:hypothetical protein
MDGEPVGCRVRVTAAEWSNADCKFDCVCFAEAVSVL